MSEQDATLQGSPSPQARGPVLLAEDDDAMRAMIASALRRDGYEVIEAANGLQLWELLETYVGDGPVRTPALVISDIRMPGASGLEVLAALRAHNPTTPVVLTTAFGDAETHAEGDRLGAQLVLDKPFDLADLRTVVRVLMGAGG